MDGHASLHVDACITNGNFNYIILCVLFCHVLSKQLLHRLLCFSVVQWTNFLNPDNIKGLSAFSMLLAMIGNGLMIPRALFIRDFMW